MDKTQGLYELDLNDNSNSKSDILKGTFDVKQKAVEESSENSNTSVKNEQSAVKTHKTEPKIKIEDSLLVVPSRKDKMFDHETSDLNMDIKQETEDENFSGQISMNIEHVSLKIPKLERGDELGTAVENTTTNLISSESSIEHISLKIPKLEREQQGGDKLGAAIENMVIKVISCDSKAKCSIEPNKHKSRRKMSESKPAVKKEQSYICTKCPFKTKRPYRLNDHYVTRHGQERVTLKCEECKYTTKVKDNLTKHVRIKHREHDKVFKCPKCHYRTATELSYLSHLESKHPEGEDIYCHHCSYKTKLKRSLIVHLQSLHDTGGEWISCHLCEYKAKVRPYLMKHYRSKHRDAKPFKCTECDYAAKEKRYLKRHAQSVHNVDGEVFKCSELHCMYQTNAKHNLNNHIRNKHKKSNLMCHLCDYTCRTSISFDLHSKTYHNDDGLVFKCTLCDYQTKAEYYLKRHVKIKHEKGEEVFKCKECSYQTNVKLYLYQHVGHKHKKDFNVFKCDCCTYETRYRHYLIKHKRSMHDLII